MSTRPRSAPLAIRIFFVFAEADDRFLPCVAAKPGFLLQCGREGTTGGAAHRRDRQGQEREQFVRIDRVAQAYKDAMKFLAIYVVIAILVLFLMRSHIADAFGATGLTRDLLYLYCGPLALMGLFNGALFISTAAYTNLGYPRYAPRISWARNTIGLFPFLAIGAYLGGVYGVAFGLLACAAFFAVISVVVANRIIVGLQTMPVVPDSEDAEEMVQEFEDERDLRSILHPEPQPKKQQPEAQEQTTA